MRVNPFAEGSPPGSLGFTILLLPRGAPLYDAFLAGVAAIAERLYVIADTNTKKFIFILFPFIYSTLVY
jgi:hypothetical protein